MFERIGSTIKVLALTTLFFLPVITNQWRREINHWLEGRIYPRIHRSSVEQSRNSSVQPE